MLGSKEFHAVCEATDPVNGIKINKGEKNSSSCAVSIKNLDTFHFLSIVLVATQLGFGTENTLKFI